MSSQSRKDKRRTCPLARLNKQMMSQKNLLDDKKIDRIGEEEEDNKDTSQFSVMPVPPMANATSPKPLVRRPSTSMGRNGGSQDDGDGGRVDVRRSLAHLRNRMRNRQFQSAYDLSTLASADQSKSGAPDQHHNDDSSDEDGEKEVWENGGGADTKSSTPHTPTINVHFDNDEHGAGYISNVVDITDPRYVNVDQVAKEVRDLRIKISMKKELLEEDEPLMSDKEKNEKQAEIDKLCMELERKQALQDNNGLKPSAIPSPKASPSSIPRRSPSAASHRMYPVGPSPSTHSTNRSTSPQPVTTPTTTMVTSPTSSPNRSRRTSPFSSRRHAGMLKAQDSNDNTPPSTGKAQDTIINMSPVPSPSTLRRRGYARYRRSQGSGGFNLCPTSHTRPPSSADLRSVISHNPYFEWVMTDVETAVLGKSPSPGLSPLGGPPEVGSPLSPSSPLSPKKCNSGPSPSLLSLKAKPVSDEVRQKLVDRLTSGSNIQDLASHVVDMYIAIATHSRPQF